MKEGEDTWCKTCGAWFEESLQDHGCQYHQDERWDVDYQKEKGSD